MTEHVIDVLVDDLLTRRDKYTPATQQAGRRCLADAIACAAAGSGGPTYSLIYTAIGPILGGAPQATVWFGNRRASLAEAMHMNSTAVAADDLDDGNRSAIGHPGGAVIPAVLGYAEALGYNGDLLMPIAFGYDAAVTVAGGRTAHRVPTMATGRWAAYGVAAAIWAMSGASREVLTRALAHAASLSPQLVHPVATAPDGLKEGTAWATLAGLAAFRLANSGVDAPLHALDTHPDFDPGWFRSTGTEPAIQETYFKRYACCRWIHPALDLIFELRRRGEMPDPASIEAIEIHTFERSLWLPNNPRPASLESAHYSFPFCVALGVFAEPAEFLPLTPAVLGHQSALSLAQRVRVIESAELTAAFPARTPIELTITASGTSIDLNLPTATGDPSLPLSDDQLAGKHAILLHHHPGVRAELSRVLRGSGPLTLTDLPVTLDQSPGKDLS
ncbi:hypothetical protein BVC93_10305 [Mycobacterium sp. MS1601]|uniref:MmgE/PrpD family protein n=1 Tax=Mycobacterium sp. MS1601 TaxID=1936029 RepID=UPI0009795F43|nr:MmgE/PrpD family protein [Mycobacterium sp. MS1601]AQA02762.1 hypothetical protein BVC93_10305 [Mycobacterium sp. MS1601]